MRQSAIRAALHYSLATCCIIYQMLAYICDHINEIEINPIFLKLWNLNQFFSFYLLNVDISLDIYTLVMQFEKGALNIALEGIGIRKIYIVRLEHLD